MSRRKLDQTKIRQTKPFLYSVIQGLHQDIIWFQVSMQNPGCVNRLNGKKKLPEQAKATQRFHCSVFFYNLAKRSPWNILQDHVVAPILHSSRVQLDNVGMTNLTQGPGFPDKILSIPVAELPLWAKNLQRDLPLGMLLPTK